MVPSGLRSKKQPYFVSISLIRSGATVTNFQASSWLLMNWPPLSVSLKCFWKESAGLRTTLYPPWTMREQPPLPMIALVTRRIFIFLPRIGGMEGGAEPCPPCAQDEDVGFDDGNIRIGSFHLPERRSRCNKEWDTGAVREPPYGRGDYFFTESSEPNSSNPFKKSRSTACNFLLFGSRDNR